MSSFSPLGLAQEAVLVKSNFDATGNQEVRGVQFPDDGGAISVDALAASMLTTGFQATNVGLAIEEINKMLRWRLSDRPVEDTDQEEYKNAEFRENTKCTIFLSYTSNLISSGLRETIKFLVKNKLVDVIVTTAGGVEEDFIKCLAPTYLGDFKLKGKDLRKQGVNRLGNLLVPNENYCKFEDWLMPILNAMTDEFVAKRRDTEVGEGCEDGEEEKIRWTPSKVIRRLGREIDNEDSVYYWAYKNNIPVFCPAITDGSLGDMMYFHSYKRPEFSVDVVHDIRRINDLAVKAFCSGMIILGGGLVKHHTCNANLMRNGADYAVYINTGQEFDGSDSGASPDEAVSWGKISAEAKPVKVSTDATLVFPLIVSQTFCKELLKIRRKEGELQEK